jgi:hypothetical protein
MNTLFSDIIRHEIAELDPECDQIPDAWIGSYLRFFQERVDEQRSAIEGEGGEAETKAAGRGEASGEGSPRINQDWVWLLAVASLTLWVISKL